MNVALEIVSQILYSQDVEPYLEAGLTEQWLTSREDGGPAVFKSADRNAYFAILQHHARHGVVPTIELFQRDFPATSYRLSADGYKASELIEQAHACVLRFRALNLLNDLNDRYEAEDFDGIVGMLRHHADSIDQAGMDTAHAQGTGGNSWEPVDLAPYLDASRPQLMPTLGRRDDGVLMLYPGRTHALVGESESGKTWAALLWAAQEIDAGNDVGYIDFEDGADGIVARLVELVEDPRSILKHFRYIHPEGSLTEAQRLADQLADCSMVVLDGIAEAMDLIPVDGHRVNIADWNAMYVRFQSAIMNPIANRGPAVLCIDHPPKSSPAARGGSGAGHKLRGLSGASYTVVNEEPMGRGLIGRSRLFVGKDRHGFVREHGGPKDDSVRLVPIACLVVDNADRERATEVFLQPDSDGWQPTTIMQRVSHLLAEADKPLSKTAIRDLLKTNKAATLKAVDELASLGYVSKQPGGYAHIRRYAGE